MLRHLVKLDLIDEPIAGLCLLRSLCRRDLFYLGTKILGYKGPRVDPSYHQWFCDELSVEEDTLILLPRDHTKSTWGIAIKVTQDILRNPNQSILLGSLTSSLSIKRLSVIRRHLERRELTTLFTDILSPHPEKDTKSSSSFYKDIKWQRDEITVMREVTRAEATVETAGVDQYRTGRHYERIYLDDIINELTIVSEIKSERALEFVKYMVPMINPQGGVIRMYGTRYGPSDLYSWLIDKIRAEIDDEFAISMRVIHREVMEEFETIKAFQGMTKREFNKRRVWDKREQKWKAFIYGYYDMELLEKKRAWIESDYIFYCQYWNRIEGVDERVFPPPYREVSAVPDGLTYYLTCDPAFKPSKQSDYTAFVVCGYGDGKIYVVEAIRQKGDIRKLLDTMYDLYKKYKFRVAGIESGAWQDIIAWVIDYTRKMEGWDRIPLKPLKLSREANAKDNRIRGLSYFFKNGKVVLREGLKDLQKELVRYPGNTRSKDDLLDALSMQRQLIPWGAKKKEEPTWERPKETWRDAVFNSRKKYRRNILSSY